MTQTNPPRKSQKMRCLISGEWKTAAWVPPSRARTRAKQVTELADGEDGDEGERVHAADVGLAVGNVHGSPEQAGAGGGEDAGDGAGGVGPLAVDGAEAEQDGGSDDGESAEERPWPGFGAGAFELAEEDAAPEDADQ